MESLNTLKKELIAQKETIESMSGYVNCAHEHPSPAEITAGIKTIPSTDLREATATEEDVVAGKTFYAGSANLRTGVSTFDIAAVRAVFMYTQNETMSSDEFYYVMPAGVKTIRSYMFSENDHIIHLSLSPDLEIIGDYSFYESRSITIDNFDKLYNLKKVGTFSFAQAYSCGIDFSNLPNNIERLSANCFQNCCIDYCTYRFPDNLTLLGYGVYKQDKRTMSSTIDFSNYTTITSIPGQLFYNHAFNCDFVAPSQVTSIGVQFNYNGSFKNVTLHSGITEVLNGAFSANVNQAVSNFYLKTVTFEGETPPRFGPTPFATQHVSNGFKIYVPDNSVEEYKAKEELSNCVDCIYPISQKE